MRVVIAVLIGLFILGGGLATLRGFAGPRGGGPTTKAEEPKPVEAGVRILYWCENCGLEVLLLRAGSEAPPRHCGESMTKRQEILRWRLLVAQRLGPLL